MKYIVMECHKSYAVVLTEDGRFLHVANLQYEVGQAVTKVIEMLEEPLLAETEETVTEAAVMQQEIPVLETREERLERTHEVKNTARSASRWSRRISSLAAIAACMVIAFVAGMRVSRIPYGSVYLTINPEVRVDVNRKKVVVGVDGLNEDGKKLLEGYQYRDKQLDPVIDELADRAIALGYLSDGGAITITMEAKDSAWATQAGDELRVHLDEYLTEKISVTIDLEEVLAEAGTQAEQTAPAETTVGTEVKDQEVLSTELYGESDYGPDYDETKATPAETVIPRETGIPDKGMEGVSDYGLEEAASDYGPKEPEPASDYDAKEPEGDSRYEAPEPEDAVSDYGPGTGQVRPTGPGQTEGVRDDEPEPETDRVRPPEREDGSSDYRPDRNDGESDYEPERGDGDSAYDREDSDDDREFHDSSYDSDDD